MNKVKDFSARFSRNCRVVSELSFSHEQHQVLPVIRAHSVIIPDFGSNAVDRDKASRREFLDPVRGPLFVHVMSTSLSRNCG